jgi:ribosome-associated heat shock protein Hsp15
MDAPVRLDLWLWAARMYRTRSQAKAAIDAGQVEVNGAPSKPARNVQPGDRIVLRRGAERLELVVEALAERRGPASIARGLYRETEASRAARAAQRAERALLGYRPPSGRPDPRARRALRRLHRDDPER